MSTNPYQAGQFPGQGSNSAAAAEMVNVPSILLMVAAGIGIVMHVVGIILYLVGMGAGAAAAAEAGADQNAQTVMMAQSIGGVIGSVVGFAFDAVVMIGALKMRKLQSFGLAMTASIFAMLPCISCGCLVGLPAGIWSLVVLNKPEVKSAFR